MTTALAPKKKKRHRSTSAGKAGWQAKFLEALSKMPNVTVAAETAHVTRDAAYMLRGRDESFKAKWDTAVKQGIERLEASAWHRAHTGILKPIWMKDANGNPVKVDEVREPSDVLTIFLLKSHKPEVYREQRDVLSLKAAAQTTNADGSQTQTAFAVQLTAEELP